MSKAINRRKKQLSSYIAGERCEEERDMSEQKTSGCRSGSEEADFLDGIIKTAQELPVLAVSDDFRKSLHERLLSEQQTVRSVKRRYLRPVSGLVAAAAVFALSLVTLNSLPQHPELTSEVQTEQSEQVYKTEEKTVSETGTVTNENSKNGDLSEGAMLKDTALTVPKSERNTARNVQPNPKTTLAPQTEAPRVETATVTGADEVINDMLSKEETVLPSEPSVAPLMTAALPPAEEKQTTDANNAEPMMKASGGGSSARSAASVAEMDCVHYYFSQVGITTARDLLQMYPQNDTGYLLSREEAQQIHLSLIEADGYLRSEIIGSHDENASAICIVLHIEA